jgi:hypothetical protein
MVYDEASLQRETILYWKDPSSDKLQRGYIGRLLRKELDYARNYPGAITKATCDVLVLLVGYAMEPLLQAVCVFQPREQILLVLNKKYESADREESGRIFGDRVKELIRSLPTELLDRELYQSDNFGTQETTEQPADVFRVLQERLQGHLRQGRKVIIDITGAKKSMVAGAFFYAAYTGTPISYIDFGKYDPAYGRPYGYTCRIGLLQDPYAAFRLHDWERMQQLCQSCQFRAARELLEGWTDPTGNPHPGLLWWMSKGEGKRYFIAEHEKAEESKPVKAVERLATVLQVYELWDNGDFAKADEIAKKSPLLPESFQAPLAIQTLGPFWPRAKEQTNPQKAARELLTALKQIETGNQALPGTPHHFAIYAHDEIAKIRRLIRFNEDYRSALLRAVGLGEALLIARWVCLWLSGRVHIAEAKEGPFYPLREAPAQIREWTKWQGGLKDAIWQAFKVSELMPGLRYADLDNYRDRASWFESRLENKGQGERKSFYLRRDLSVPWIDSVFLLDSFKNLRDKAIHTYLSVPKVVADETLRIVCQSLEDYQKQWATHVDSKVAQKVGIDRDYEPLQWEHLYDICGIDFLPPRIVATSAPMPSAGLNSSNAVSSTPTRT